VKSEGDSPISCRAESSLSLSNLISGASGEVSGNSPTDVLEEAGSKMAVGDNSEQASCEEMEDICHSPGAEVLDEEFCVADVRRRLGNLSTPKKIFKRDPEDPSGEKEDCMAFLFHTRTTCGRRQGVDHLVVLFREQYTFYIVALLLL